VKIATERASAVAEAAKALAECDRLAPDQMSYETMASVVIDSMSGRPALVLPLAEKMLRAGEISKVVLIQDRVCVERDCGEVYAWAGTLFEGFTRTKAGT